MQRELLNFALRPFLLVWRHAKHWYLLELNLILNFVECVRLWFSVHNVRNVQCSNDIYACSRSETWSCRNIILEELWEHFCTNSNHSDVYTINFIIRFIYYIAMPFSSSCFVNYNHCVLSKGRIASDIERNRSVEASCRIYVNSRRLNAQSVIVIGRSPAVILGSKGNEFIMLHAEMNTNEGEAM